MAVFEGVNILILTAGPRHPSSKILSFMAGVHLFKKPFYSHQIERDNSGKRSSSLRLIFQSHLSWSNCKIKKTNPREIFGVLPSKVMKATTPQK